MRRRRFLATLGTGTVTGLAGCSGIIGPFGRAEPAGPPRLGVDGRWLTDPDGNRVVLRGVNVVDPWWGTTYADLRGKDYWETLELATDPDEGWHTRVVRVPVEPRSIREEGVETLAEKYLDRIVELVGERGAYVIVDYHAVERYDTADVDGRIRRFWREVAPRYADETHVLYELFNEPTEPAGDGRESWDTWREHAQPWVDLIRRHAPETPVVVGSPRWSSLLRHAPDAPFDGDDLLYSGHVFPSWSIDDWEPMFGDPALDVPVFISEWGYIGVEDENTEPHMIATTDGWGRPFREWLDGHENVNWCAWTFDSEWYPPMFDSDWNLLGGDEYMGEFTRRWLADRRDDHQPGGAGEPTPTPDDRPPSAPRNLRVVERRATAVDLAWDEATAPEGVAIVQYRVSVDEREEYLLPGSGRSVTVDGLDPGTRYEFAVVAVADGGRASPDPATVTVETRADLEPVATIPRTESPPAVDGSVDDAWAAVDAHSVDNVLIPGPNEGDLAAEWRACWDETTLYYLVSVTDDTPTVDSDEAYQDDNVEIYLDPDNSRESRYDRADDAQYTVLRGEDRIRPGANSVDAPGAAAVGQTETDDGYRVAVALPWDDLGVTPAAGTVFGTDVHVNDDVDGDERDAKIAWHATEDDSWENPRSFALVELGD